MLMQSRKKQKNFKFCTLLVIFKWWHGMKSLTDPFEEATAWIPVTEDKNPSACFQDIIFLTFQTVHAVVQQENAV